MLSTAQHHKMEVGGDHPMQSSSSHQKRSQYVYTPLKETSVDSQDPYNFFGVIIDAAYPYKTPQGKFICTVKVIDHSFHHTSSSGPQFASVIIYAKRFEDLPIVYKIGDIIRIHRANMKQFNDLKQFHVNVYYNSSWCIFKMQTDGKDDGGDDQEYMEEEIEQSENEDRPKDEEDMDDSTKQLERAERRKYRPYKFSGKSYTFDVNHERALLDDLRAWALNFFQKEYVLTRDMYKLLGELKNGQMAENQEFDLLVKVLKVFDKDEHTLELRIKDTSQKMWFMSIPRLKFQSILSVRGGLQGEIVRIRCVELNLTTKRDVIQVKPYTNILRIHSNSRIYQELSKSIDDEKDTDKLLLDEGDDDIVMTPIIYTEILNQNMMQLQKMQTFKLTDLFLHYDQFSQEMRDRNLFKVRFFCLRIDPQDVREIVQAMCPVCKECYSCAELEADGRGLCKPCRKECTLVYKLQLLVKDSSSQLNKNFYRLLLFSYDAAHGLDFFQGLEKPVNLYKNEAALARISKHIANMQRFNVWCDALIERQSSYFVIRDTQIKDIV